MFRSVTGEWTGTYLLGDEVFKKDRAMICFDVEQTQLSTSDTDSTEHPFMTNTKLHWFISKLGNRDTSTTYRKEQNFNVSYDVEFLLRRL